MLRTFYTKRMPVHVARLATAAMLFAAAHRLRGGETQSKPPQQALAREMLAAHNAVRAQRKVPPLAWSDELAKYAQEWANRLASSNQFVHRPNPVYGENLFLIHGAQARPAQVVQAWASEAGSYNYQSNSCQGRCGHYTQLVWRDTKRVGCGTATRDGTEVWVCNYDPPGNIIGERPY